MSAPKPYQPFGSSENKASEEEAVPASLLQDLDRMLASSSQSAPAAPAPASEDPDAMKAEFETMFASQSHDAAADFSFKPAAPKSEAIKPQGPLSTGKLGRYATDDVAQRPAGAPRRSSAEIDVPVPPVSRIAPLESADSEARPAKPAMPANLFGEDQAADLLNTPTAPSMSTRSSRFSPASPSPRPQTPVFRESFSPPPDTAPVNEGTLGQQVLDELEKYSISSVSQLRIAVHGGTVTILGDVPSDYEKKLVVHFARKVNGVNEVVDMMRIIGGQGLTSGPDVPGAKRAPKKKPRPSSRSAGLSLSFPFRAKHVGIAAGLLISIWAGYSFATRDGADLSCHAVSGTVMFDGAPAEGATVVLHPEDRSLTIRPRGFVGKDGTFHVTTYLPEDGAPSGEYRVTVEWKKPVSLGGDEYAPGPNLLPDALGRPESTRYSVKVGWGTNEIPAINIAK